MPDVHVRVTGTVEDLDGRELTIGSDYDSVRVGEYRFTSSGFGELMQLLIAAHWEAARCGIEQELDAYDDGSGRQPAHLSQYQRRP